MGAIDIAFRLLAADKEKAFAFFGLFSRLEYSLKRAGYIVKGRPYLACDWTAFAKTACAAMKSNDDPQFLNAVAFLNERFPRRQNTDMTWDEETPPNGATPIQKAIHGTVRVRHNLFHGSKSEIRNSQRNNDLIGASIVVLNECSAIDDVRRFYYGG